jgi:DNA-binding NarL/FixJ family response regulator
MKMLTRYAVALPESGERVCVELSPQTHAALLRESRHTNTPLAALVLRLARRLLPALTPKPVQRGEHDWPTHRDATIRALTARGVALSAIAKELGVNRNTVRYHRTRLQLPDHAE